MDWPGDRVAVAELATGAVIRIVSDGQSRRLRYGLPILLITVTTGPTLTLSAFGGRPILTLILVPVLAVAFGRGLWPALATVVLAGALIALALPPVGMPWLNDPAHLGALGLLIAEGASLAIIGAAVRATLRRAISDEPPAEAQGQVAVDRSCPVGGYLAEHLTPRETEVLRMAASGRNVEELSAELSVSPNTVKTHLAHCYGKLGAHSRAEAVALGVRSGVLRTNDLNGATEATGGTVVDRSAVDLSARIGGRQEATRGPSRVIAPSADVRRITLRGDDAVRAQRQGVNRDPGPRSDGGAGCATDGRRAGRSQRARRVNPCPREQ